MTKYTIGVYKSFRNSGMNRFHRNKTKKHWKRFFLDDDDGTFNTEWVSNFKAMILKRNVWKKRMFVCLECETWFKGIVKGNKEIGECPNCDE